MFKKWSCEFSLSKFSILLWKSKRSISEFHNIQDSFCILYFHRLLHEFNKNVMHMNDKYSDQTLWNLFPFPIFLKRSSAYLFLRCIAFVTWNPFNGQKLKEFSMSPVVNLILFMKTSFHFGLTILNFSFYFISFFNV